MNPNLTLIQVTRETRDMLRELGKCHTPKLPIGRMTELLAVQAWGQETGPELAEALRALIECRTPETLRTAKAAFVRAEMLE